jgi:3-mercaptopyruvate sulfurtransferase SseA
MKKRNLLVAFSILVFAALACNASLPQATEPTIIPTQPQAQNPNGNIPQTEADVPRISVKDAKAAFDSGQAIIVDVRSADSYAAGHAAGSTLNPVGKFREQYRKSFPRKRSMDHHLLHLTK